MNFFSFSFPLREYFFCTSPAPPPPHKFSNGPSLNQEREHMSVLLRLSPLFCLRGGGGGVTVPVLYPF